MFCPNCGTDCGEAKFCSECGTKLHRPNETNCTTRSDGADATESAVNLDIPVGKYDGTFGYVELRDAEVFLHKKVFFKTFETSIRYTDITAVAYQKSTGFSTGFLSIRSRQECFIPLADKSNAASDKTALVFGSQMNAPMYHIYQCLQAFAERNNIDCTVEDIPDKLVSSGVNPTADVIPIDRASSDTNQSLNPCSIDMDDYFERFNSNKVAAIKTIVYETGMDLRQAKELVDREFARRQKNLHTTTKRSLNTQIAEHNKRKAELDKQGIAYCPKCLSTSITADKKGFGIGKAVVGAYLVGSLGLMAGNIHAKKVRLTCMKCGYQWMAGKK